MKKLAWSFAIFAIGFGAVAPAPAAALYNLGSLSYREIGPAIAGGRTTAVVGSDADTQVYYAGGAGGGVFKSTDGGSSWSPIFDKADVAAIGAIALAPGDPRDVWVGTGESNPRNDVEEGDGIWHSADGGKTWKHLGLDDAGSISSISIDPRDPRKVAVGVLGHIFADSAMRGVYVTSDGGAHWSRRLYVGVDVGASDLVRVPGRPDTLYAGMYQFRRKPWTMISGGDLGGVYRSVDGGMTWRKLSGDGLPGAPTGRIGLAAGVNNRVYALIQSSEGDLWRSDDGGATFHLMPHSPLIGDRRFYFTRIFVDPANADRLIDVGLVLSMSTDGGRSFKKIATNGGWDYHNIWWSADGNRVAVGTDEGALFSSDGGASWRQPYDLPFAQPYHIGFDDAQPNYHICIGLQDNDTWCGIANGDSGLGVLNRDWTTVSSGDGMWSLFDPADPHLVWSTSTNSDTGQVYLWDSRTQQAYDVSPDAHINGQTPASDLDHRFNWDTPIAFTHDGKALVGGNVVYESADRGQTWTIISPDLTRNEKSHQSVSGGPIDSDMSGAETSDTLLDIAPSQVDPQTIWTGSDDGLVHVTRDAGAHWADVTPRTFPMWGRVATVEPGRYSASTAFAAVDDHMLGDDRPYLFMTRDGGATWSSISGDLPNDVFLRSVRQDPVDPDLLYAGSQRGMWASWDLGSHWQSLRLNMPASAIYDIEIQPRTNDLLVAAHGRGVWVLDDLHALQTLPSVASTGMTLIAPRQTTRWWQWSPINSFPSGMLPTNVFAGQNVRYGAILTYWLRSGSHGPATIDIIDAHGRVIRHLHGKDVPHSAGINRATWDLNEDGPAKWLGTFEDNQGPATGPEAMPGSYTVRLQIDGATAESPLVVVSDPRDTSTLAQLQSRHDALAELLGELGAVDTMLNTIDQRMKSATAQNRTILVSFKQRLTYDPRNVEDLGSPAGLREKLQDLIGRIQGSSFQAPTQAQSVASAELKTSFDEIQSAFAALRL